MPEPVRSNVPDRNRPLVDDLAVAIARVHTGERAGRTAREVLGRDRDRTRLVGLTPDAAVVYVDEVAWSVVRHDLAVGELQQGRRLEGSRNGEAWVARTDVEFAWLHPRYRWVDSR